MSAKKAVEFTRPPRKLGGDAISLAVRFNYPDGTGWKGNLTVHAEDRAELKVRLKEAYEDKRPRASVDALIEELKDEDGLDFED